MKHFILSIMCLLGFSTCVVTQTKGAFTDKRDNKTYQTVTLSNVVWMAENLNYTSKNAWCIDCENYGRHYTYEEALTACPEGWHLSTFDEWKKLSLSLDLGAGDIKTTTGWAPIANGGEGNGNNDYNFSAKPGGKCDSEGRVEMQGTYGFWWTSDIKDEKKAKYWYAGSDIDYLDFDAENKTSGLSVRCVMDK